MFSSGWPKVRRGPASARLPSPTTWQPRQPIDLTICSPLFGVAARRALRRRARTARVFANRYATIALISTSFRDGVFRRAVVRVVPEPRHPGRRLHRARIANPGLHPVRRQLRVDLRQDRPGLPDVRVEALASCGRRSSRRARRSRRPGSASRPAGTIHLLLVALGARRLGHPRRQHRVVPQVRLFPVVLLFPLVLLLLVAAACARRRGS